jgi:hypothetical protein
VHGFDHRGRHVVRRLAGLEISLEGIELGLE